MTGSASSLAAAVACARVARPTGDLAAIRRFYVQGLGLPLLTSFEDHDGISGLVLGTPGDALQLEFTHEPGAAHAARAPSPEHSLVLYVSGSNAAATIQAAVQRLEALGYGRVAAHNPWWAARGGVTVADPEGWRVVLAPHQAAWLDQVMDAT